MLKLCGKLISPQTFIFANFPHLITFRILSERHFRHDEMKRPAHNRADFLVLPQFRRLAIAELHLEVVAGIEAEIVAVVGDHVDGA